MAATQRQFNPYSENGGTILAIAGADFSVIAGDTRQSEGYSIQTRYAPKVFRLCVYCDWLKACSSRVLMHGWNRTDRAVLAVNGFAADGNMFVKSVKQRLEVYFHNFSSANLATYLPRYDSGTVMHTQKTCLFVLLHG